MVIAGPRGLAAKPALSGGLWRDLKRGMTAGEVRGLLGEPNRVEAGILLTYWYYANNSHVLFDAKTMKVDGWTEPQR